MNLILNIFVLFGLKNVFVFGDFIEIEHVFELPQVEHSTDVEEHFFRQVVDHFDPNNTQYFFQRYMVNKKFFEPSKRDIAFLHIGGESEIKEALINSGAWLIYTQMFGAIIFTLEHRYYGVSHPFRDLSTKNLRYLTSRQALEDLASFIVGINEEYNLSSDVKWIVTGGSYPASLAAWLKMKYPHLVRAAVSSSGVFLAEFPFVGYVKVIEHALAAQSKRCLYAVKAAFTQLKHVMGSPERKKLKEIFYLCSDVHNHTTAVDMANIFRYLSAVFINAAQTNGHPLADVQLIDLCNVMTNSKIGGLLQRLALLIRMYLDQCLDYSYDAVTEILRITHISREQYARQWFYQICTEFGWYHVTSEDFHLFANSFPAQIMGSQCADVFGPEFTIPYLSGQIAETNIHYGGRNLDVRDVLFTEGSFDPWRAVGIGKSANDFSPYILIQGASHCSDFYTPSETDSDELRNARKKTVELIRKWLNS